MRSYYFNAKPTSDLESHPTGYDRVYDAHSRADYHAPEATEGIFATTNDACQAHVVEGNIIGINEGYANYRGYRCHVEGDETIEVTASGYIALRWDNTEAVRAFVLALTPALIDTETIHDLPLALVTVTDGEITAIEDKREWVQWTRLPPYYPPDSDAVPIALWRYIIGLPMTDDEREQVEASPELMQMYNNSKLTAAGRYGLKFEAKTSTYYKSYNGSQISSAQSGNFVFTSSYDPLEMLGDDNTTFTVPASVHKLRIYVKGIFAQIGLSESWSVFDIRNGDETVVSFGTTHLSSSTSEYPTEERVKYIEVSPGDQFVFYGLARTNTPSLNSQSAACVQINDIRIEVVE